jgi:hypothetical protein
MALPRRIGGSEWSHGGYPTLVAPTRWPEPFGAGATLAGMSDLRTFFAGTEPRDADVPVPESVQACPEPSARVLRWTSCCCPVRATPSSAGNVVQLTERVTEWFDRWP